MIVPVCELFCGLSCCVECFGLCFLLVYIHPCVAGRCSAYCIET
jgi:hypothetical protein